MNLHGSITLPWADGDHLFRLGLDEVEELEEICDTSVFLLLAATGANLPFAKLKHYRATIRLGLIGGGMSPLDALAKVRKFVDRRPLAESVAVAHAILEAAMRKVHSGEPDQPGEALAANSSASTSPPSEETPS